MIEILVPEPSQGAIDSILETHQPVTSWSTPLPDGKVRTSVLSQGGTTHAIMEDLEDRLEAVQDAHVVLMSVEATLPHPSELDETMPPEGGEIGGEPSRAPGPATGRVSTAELFQEVLEMSRMSRYYVALVILSTIVAAMGMISGSTVVIVGAMVIAPLIGPNVGLALSTTLADLELAKESVWTNALGALIAVLVSIVIGYGLNFDPTSAAEIMTRTWVGYPDVALALAAGAAAVLSLSVGVSTALVGVMVAVALLPPLVACGMLIGVGEFQLGAFAGFLALTNFICINLAGVVTFIIQGVRPSRYWEAEKARRSTVFAVILWTLLLALLVAVIWQVFGATLTPPTRLP